MAVSSFDLAHAFDALALFIDLDIVLLLFILLPGFCIALKGLNAVTRLGQLGYERL